MSWQAHHLLTLDLQRPAWFWAHHPAHTKLCTLVSHPGMAVPTAELSGQQEQSFKLDIHQITHQQSSYDNDIVRIIFGNKLLTHGL